MRELEPGDHIQIGDCVFQYSASEAKAPQAIAPAGIVMQSTVRLQQGDQRLEALIRAATAFGALESAEAVSEALLESIFAVLPAAEKGAVIRASRPLTKSAARIVGRDRAGEMVGPVAISLTAVNQVLAEGTALLSNEVLADGRVMTSGSLGGHLRASPAQWPDWGWDTRRPLSSHGGKFDLPRWNCGSSGC